MRSIILTILLFCITGCSSIYPNKNILGQTFPSISGQNLEQQSVLIPDAFKGEKTLLLIGYKQNSQFDIDRWLIALDMTETSVNVLNCQLFKAYSLACLVP